MKSINNLDKGILLLTFVILIGLISIFAIGRTISGEVDSIGKLNYNIRQEYERRSRYDKLISDYNKIEKEGIIYDIESKLPDADHFIEVILELEEISKLSKAELFMSLGATRLTSDGFEVIDDSIDSEVATAPDGNKYIQVQLSVRGTYQQFEQFVHLFEQSEFYMNILNLNMNRVAGNRVAAFMDVNIFVDKVVVNNE